MSDKITVTQQFEASPEEVFDAFLAGLDDVGEYVEKKRPRKIVYTRRGAGQVVVEFQFSVADTRVTLTEEITAAAQKETVRAEWARRLGELSARIDPA